VRQARGAWVGLALVFACTGCGGAAAPEPDVRIECKLEPSPPVVGPLSVDIAISDAAGRPVGGADVRIEGNMSHPGMVPVEAHADEMSVGRYRASMELSMAGDWFLLLEAELTDGRRIDRTIDVPNVLRR
jgi:hypothetical protein